MIKIELHTHEAFYADQMLSRLRAEAASAASNKALAAKIGISPQFLHDMLKGRRQITGKALEFLGFAEITVYYKIGGWK